MNSKHKHHQSDGTHTLNLSLTFINDQSQTQVTLQSNVSFYVLLDIRYYFF